jgi:hypothetical protein
MISKPAPGRQRFRDRVSLITKKWACPEIREQPILPLIQIDIA